MRVGIMITNGNESHPPEKWAEQTAQQLTDVIEIEPTSPVYSGATDAKEALRKTLETEMVKHHTLVQDHAWDVVCKERKPEDVDKEITPEQVEASVKPYLDDAVADVLKITDGTMFAAYYRKPEVTQFVRSTIGSHFSSIAHIEHSWDRDDRREALRARGKSN